MWLAGRLCIAFMGAWCLWTAVNAFNGGPTPLVTGWGGHVWPPIPARTSPGDALWVAAGFGGGAVVFFYLALAPKPSKVE